MKKTISLLMLGWILITSLSWCSNFSTSTESKWPEAVKIGVIAPLSGPWASVGEDMIAIYKMAVDEFNNTNKVQIKLIIEDWKCSGKDATSATQKLINIDKVDLIFWWSCSSETIASAQITQPLDILNFSATASSPLVSEIGDYVFRFYNDLDDAKFLTQYLISKWISNVWIIYENSDYAVAYTNTIKNVFPSEFIFEKKYNSDEKDFDLFIKSIEKDFEKIEKLIIIPQTDINFINIMKSLNRSSAKYLSSNIIVSSIAWTETTFKEIPNLIEWVSSVMLPDYWVLWEKSENFIKNLNDNYKIKTNELYAVFFKESIDLILRAIKNWNYDSKSIRNYIISFWPNKQIDGYRWKYYFTWSDTVGLKMIIQQIQSWALATIE